MPKIDIASVSIRFGAGCPSQFNAPSTERKRQQLGYAGGLADFGVNGQVNAIGIQQKTNLYMFSKAN